MDDFIGVTREDRDRVDGRCVQCGHMGTTIGWRTVTAPRFGAEHRDKGRISVYGITYREATKEEAAACADAFEQAKRWAKGLRVGNATRFFVREG
jgi:hypothetical protein